MPVADYLASIRSANENGAAVAVQVVNTAEVAANIRTGGYLPLEAPAADALLVWDIVRDPPRGYRIEVEPRAESYRVFATPLSPARSGTRSFYSDASLIIRAADRQGGRAGPDDPQFTR